MRAFVDALGNAGQLATVSYRSLASVAATSPIWQVAGHVVNHGTYHRGQVTTMSRQLGVHHVQGTDLITFFRERGGARRPPTARACRARVMPRRRTRRGTRRPR